MKLLFNVCFVFIMFMINLSYGQSYECDNNFEDCGTPNQSGGGGGGGSILIANTDLGDSYQHADDYDDDGIEDPSDNCPRTMNPDQLDRDGDGVGDSCDNCLSIWNSKQENADGDESGDFCDEDIDGDAILNYHDECPYHWGNESCFMINAQEKDYTQVNENISQSSMLPLERKQSNKNIFKEKNVQSCNSSRDKSFLSLFFVFVLLIVTRKKYHNERRI